MRKSTFGRSILLLFFSLFTPFHFYVKIFNWFKALTILGHIPDIAAPEYKKINFLNLF